MEEIIPGLHAELEHTVVDADSAALWGSAAMGAAIGPS